jgi:hypothetical protein
MIPGTTAGVGLGKPERGRGLPDLGTLFLELDDGLGDVPAMSSSESPPPTSFSHSSSYSQTTPS